MPEQLIKGMEDPQKRKMTGRTRERLRGWPSLSRKISRIKAKGGKNLLTCLEKYCKEHKIIQDFFLEDLTINGELANVTWCTVEEW